MMKLNIVRILGGVASFLAIFSSICLLSIVLTTCLGLTGLSNIIIQYILLFACIVVVGLVILAIQTDKDEQTKLLIRISRPKQVLSVILILATSGLLIGISQDVLDFLAKPSVLILLVVIYGVSKIYLAGQYERLVSTVLDKHKEKNGTVTVDYTTRDTIEQSVQECITTWIKEPLKVRIGHRVGVYSSHFSRDSDGTYVITLAFVQEKGKENSYRFLFERNYPIPAEDEEEEHI